MAQLLQAINRYGPRLDLNKTAQLDQIVDWMASRTGLNKSEVMMVLQELNEAILFFNGAGTPVKLPGVGTFTPSISRDGQFRVKFRADQALKNGLNAANAYHGRMVNKANIGISNEDLKAAWDADNPDDLLEL